MSQLIPLDSIDPSPWAALFPTDENHVATLVEDMKDRGLCEPVHVYPTGKRYELLSGHDRLEAAKRLGWTEIAAVKRSTLTDEDKRWEYFVKANTLRKGYDAKAVAEAALRRHPDWTQHRVAQYAGISPSTVNEAKGRLQVLEPQLFAPNTIGKDGVAQPARKPRKPHIPTAKDVQAHREKSKPETIDKLGSLRMQRVRQAEESDRSLAIANPALTAPATGERAAAILTDDDRSTSTRGSDIRRFHRRLVPTVVRDLISAAISASTVADDADLSGIQTNDMMISGLVRARAMLDRIIAAHNKRAA